MAPSATYSNGAWNGASAANGAAPINPTAARHEATQTIRVESNNVEYSAEHITSKYSYNSTHVAREAGPDGKETLTVKPQTKQFEFRTERTVPKTG